MSKRSDDEVLQDYLRASGVGGAQQKSRFVEWLVMFVLFAVAAGVFIPAGYFLYLDRKEDAEATPIFYTLEGEQVLLRYEGEARPFFQAKIQVDGVITRQGSGGSPAIQEVTKQNASMDKLRIEYTLDGQILKIRGVFFNGEEVPKHPTN